jgi:hypothetical protein
MKSGAGYLAGIPDGLRSELLASLNEIERNFRERRWEPSELNGGKLCEVVYSVIRGHGDGKYPARATKPKNMADACKALEQLDSGKFSRAFRIQIPRVLVALYEVRNNRGVGHVGGDVNPNAMDAAFVLSSSKWLVAELIRAFHAVDTDEAERAVELLIERTLPVIWQVGDVRRVLVPGLSMRSKTMLLLYHTSGWVEERALVAWVEHSNPAVYRRDVLAKSHKDRLLEYDRTGARAMISPLGVNLVEKELLPGI